MSDLISTDVPQLIVKTRVGDFTVEPIRMGKFKTFSTLATPIANDIMNYMDGAGDVVALIDTHETPLFELVALCCGLTDQQYQTMLPDDYTELVGAVIEINADFFVRNLLPKVAGRIESIMGRVQSIKSQMTGMMPSNPSETMATA